MVWKTIGAERRRINSWSTERGSRSYYQNLTVIHFPLLGRSIQGPPLFFFSPLFLFSSSSPAMPTTWTLLSGLHGRFGQTLFPQLLCAVLWRRQWGSAGFSTARPGPAAVNAFRFCCAEVKIRVQSSSPVQVVPAQRPPPHAETSPIT